MTLYDRAQKINAHSVNKDLLKCKYDTEKSNLNNVMCLHKQVQNLVPPNTLAQYISKGANRAKVEVRNAANKCLLDSKWANFSDLDKQNLINALMDLMFGFGPIEKLLDDKDVTEIMVNGVNSIYYEKFGKLYLYDKSFSSDEQIRALVDRILGPLGRRIDESSPMVNARLDEGHRVHVVIPPLSLVGTVLTIRKFSEHVISLEEMLKTASIDVNLLKFLEWAIICKKNIAVSGGTGSGKTTLLNALSCKISHSERLITIEDSAELRFYEHPHVVSLEARQKNSEDKGEVTIRDLVINALRMRPDRIIVGECRGAEALDMLQAMNTGHEGSLTTLHANSPVEIFSRLTTMVRYAVDLPVDVIENYIASAIDLVIQVTRSIDGNRYISEVVSLSYDYKSKTSKLEPIYKREPFKSTGYWLNYPDWLNDDYSDIRLDKEEVKKWKSLI